jgi:hypothetical protein
MSTGFTFPLSWGPNCPPNTALDANGEYFRVVAHDPPHDDDFVSGYDLGRVSPRSSNPQKCKARALSGFRTLEEAIDNAERYPDHGILIAARILTPDRGKTTQAGAGTHTDWWYYEGIIPREGFAVVGRARNVAG